MAASKATVGVSESDIQRAILTTLSYRRDVKVWRQNTGAMELQYKGKKRFMRFNVPGAADITGILKPSGVRVEIEVKRPGGKLSANQRQFREMVQDCGGVYILATSVDEAISGVCEAIEKIAGERLTGEASSVF